MLIFCCSSLTFREVSPHEAAVPFVVSRCFCFVLRVCTERGFAGIRASRNYSGGRARIPVDGDDVLVTRRADGTIVMAVWNLSAPGGNADSKNVVLQLNSLAGESEAFVYRLDEDHGSLMKAYAAVGSPTYPTPAQIQSLRHSAQLPAPESRPLQNGQIALRLGPNALVLIEVY
jgi:Glycosyl hydrolases family 39